MLYSSMLFGLPYSFLNRSFLSSSLLILSNNSYHAIPKISCSVIVLKSFILLTPFLFEVFPHLLSILYTKNCAYSIRSMHNIQYIFLCILYTCFCLCFFVYFCRGDLMKLCYKINVLESLKLNGYSTYRLRKENIFGQATIQKFRFGEGVGWDTLETLCNLLNCQPSDIIEMR